MNNIAIIFPGQGLQTFKLLENYYKNFQIVRNIFNKASDKLQIDLWNSRKKHTNIINKENIIQPMIITANFAIWKILNKLTNSIIVPQVFAGHSLGEYSALIASNSIKFSDGIYLTYMRNKIMNQEIKHNKTIFIMSAIIGLPKNIVLKCCKKASYYGIVEPANFNSCNQIVISGEQCAVKKANEFANKQGAKKTKILPLKIPAHSSLMLKASIKLKKIIKNIDIHTPNTTVLHNVDGQKHTKNNIKNILIKHIHYPVQWSKTMDKIINYYNVKTIIECGANNVLTSINKRIYKNIKHVSTKNIENLNICKNNAH